MSRPVRPVASGRRRPAGLRRRCTACTPTSSAAAAEEVTARIREAGLRTVRRGHRRPARPAARQVPVPGRRDRRHAQRAGLLRRDLQPGHRATHVFPPAFAAGGGFGIEEFTGFPDVVHRARPVDVPGAAVGARHRLDALRRVLQHRPADAAGRPRACCAASWTASATRCCATSAGSRSSSTSSAVSTRASRPTATTQPAAPPDVEPFRARLPVPVRGAAGLGQRHADGAPRRAGRRRPAAPLDGGRVGPGPDGVQPQPAAGPGAPPTRWCCSAARSSRCAQRRGLLATFMCKPHLPNFFAVRLAPARVAARRRTARNAFTDRGRVAVAARA